ncbi:MAG: methyl-accepting chemotaxis protein [Treponema sp.]|nr:methyl-accepting chemotaxis protein [Treponema sp.]
MALLRNIKIRGKLFLGFFLLLAITIFLAAFSIINIQTVNANYILMMDNPVRRYNYLNYMYGEIVDLRRINAIASFRLGDREAIDGLRSLAGFRMAEVGNLLEAYITSNQSDLLIDPARQAYLLEHSNWLGEGIQRYYTEVLSVMFATSEAGTVGDPVTRAAVEIILNRGEELFEELDDIFILLRDGAQTTLDNRSAEIINITDATVALLIVLSIIGVVLGVGTAILISGTVTKPIAKLSAALGDVANGDLTKRLSVLGKDETAQASSSYNQSMDEFGKMIASIKSQSQILSEIGNDLASNMTETASAMNEIAANIQSIKSRVMNQSASVTETNSTMEQVANNIGKLNQHIESQASAVSQSSSSIEEMIANIKSVTEILSKNTASVKDLQESANTGRSSLQEVATDIQDIAKESEGLMEINSVMENIASQTNLLSMNAAIEAAHAGEAGKGFAVVAAEIRKLAESSGEQSKTIGSVLKKIKESIDKITRSTEKVMNRFEDMDYGVKTVADQEETIRNAMEEQSQGSKQILEATGHVNEITQHVKSGSIEMLEGSKEVMQESKNLERMTQEITNGMNEMAVGAEQVNRAVLNVNDLSSRTKDNISALVQSVSRFKV